VQKKVLLLLYINIAPGNMKYKRMKIQRLQSMNQTVDFTANQNQLLGPSHTLEVFWGTEKKLKRKMDCVKSFRRS